MAEKPQKNRQSGTGIQNPGGPIQDIAEFLPISKYYLTNSLSGVSLFQDDYSSAVATSAWAGSQFNVKPDASLEFLHKDMEFL